MGTDFRGKNPLLCDQNRMDPTIPTLWWCRDAEDVAVIQDNAVCKAWSASWDDMDQAADVVEMFQFILVAVPPGREREEIVDELTKRFAVPVLVPEKDAFCGFSSVVELVRGKSFKAIDALLFGAQTVPVHGLINLADVDCSKQFSENRVLSGFRELDSRLGGFSPGEMSIWTGKRGEGKSTILGQIMLEALNQGHRVCVYSGELSEIRFKQALQQQAAGFRYVKPREDERTGHVFYNVDPDAAKRIDAWWDKRLILTDIKEENAHAEDHILKMFQFARRMYGCDVFFLDNIMTVQLKNVASMGFWQAQSEFAGRIVAFAKANGVHVHMVAHPRKTEKRLESDDVGGSGDITNRADNVLKVERVNPGMEDEAGHAMLLTVMKNREFGELPRIELDFNPADRRFFPAGKPDGKKYSWEEAAMRGG